MIRPAAHDIMIEQSNQAVKQRLESSLLVKQIVDSLKQSYTKVSRLAADIYCFFMRRAGRWRVVKTNK
jgi:hypothetical protein